jgi:hypothetical protein
MSEMPLRAQKCLECNEYVNWKARVTSLKAIVAFVVTTAAGVLGIILAWPKLTQHDLPTPPPLSRTEVQLASFSKNGTRLVVLVTNHGTAPSQISTKFTLSLEKKDPGEPAILRFGPLRVPSPDLFREVRPDVPVRLELFLDRIDTTFDTDADDFWKVYGERVVTLTGSVTESNKVKRSLTSTAPLHVLKPFIQRRTVTGSRT